MTGIHGNANPNVPAEDSARLSRGAGCLRSQRRAAGRSRLRQAIAIVVMFVHSPLLGARAGPNNMVSASHPLTQRSVENVVAFTRLLGYVRYFHPSDEAGATDWDAFAVDGIRAVEGAQSDGELALTLRTLFQPIAPLIHVFTSGDSPDDGGLVYQPRKARADLKVTAWRHHGVGLESSHYQSTRDVKDATDPSVPGSFLDPSKIFRADLGPGVKVAMPCALYVDGSSTLPRGIPRPRAAPVTDQDPSETPGDARRRRLAAVVLAWNVFQHFYPYFDQVETDWPAALRDALLTAATDADDRAFRKTLQKLVAVLQDGHGRVKPPIGQQRYLVPVTWAWIENSLVVTAVKPDPSIKLLPGDVVVKVNGKPVSQVLQELETYVSAATPQWRRILSIRELGSGLKMTGIDIEVHRPSEEPFNQRLLHSVYYGVVQESRPEPIVEIEPGVFYVDLSRVPNADFTQALPALQECKGIVFDLRGYRPTLPPYSVPISHLIDKPVDSPRWLTPVVTRPDHIDMEFLERRWTIEPRAPRLAAKVVYITDGIALSAAETHLAIVRHYKIAPIVGGPTAGTNGDVNPFQLPGGFSIRWTGLRVLNHDGSQFHGIGVLPTIPCSRTIKGVRAGRDELLERAIQVVRP